MKDAPATQVRPSRPRSAPIVLLAVMFIFGTIAIYVILHAGFFKNFFSVDPAELAMGYRLDGTDPGVVRVVKTARQVVRQSPESGAAWGRLGMIYLANGMKQPAAACFDKAETLAPMEPRWPYFRATALPPLDPSTVVTELQRAVTNTPADVPAPRLWLAEMLTDRVQFDEAEGLLRQVAASHPNDTRAVLDRGRLEIARRNFQAGIVLVQQALAAAPNLSSAHLLLSRARHGLGQLSEAQREADLAATGLADPPWPDSWMDEVAAMRAGEVADVERANLLLRDGKVKPAFDLLRQTMEDHPNCVPGLLAMGEALRMGGQSADAERAILAAVKLQPGSVDARSELGTLYLHLGRYVEAAGCFREAVRIQPSLAPAWLLLGASLERTNTLEDAVVAMKQSLALDPKAYYAHYLLADLSDRMGKHDEAIAEARQAASLAGGDLRPRRLLDRLTSTTRPATAPSSN